jgi:class 3 adenylate cyclase/ketosteroid isomerase-like protein
MDDAAELTALVQRLYRLWLVDHDYVMFDRLLSRSDDLVVVGTDPDEWWTGFTQVSQVLRTQGDELDGTQLVPGAIRAWASGDLGWVVDQPTARFPGGREFPMRASLVFRREAGDWKVVHWHLSRGTSNVDDLGIELTTSIDAIASSVADERPDLGSTTAPDGTVTILITDIEGSSAITEGLGDRDWFAVRRTHNRIVREHVAQHGGFVVKAQGDGFMIAFSSARRALRCAVVLQRAVATQAWKPAIRIRAGLHTGEVLREGDDFYGKTVVLATRITAAASGSEILASALVRALTESSGEFTFDDGREVELKGLAGKHLLHPVIWT